MVSLRVVSNRTAVLAFQRLFFPSSPLPNLLNKVAKFLAERNRHHLVINCLNSEILTDFLEPYPTLVDFD